MIDRPTLFVVKLYGESRPVEQPARFSKPSRRFARQIRKT